MTEREKLLMIHDWVAKRNEYPDELSEDAHSAAALVLNGNAVCSGYADTVKLMCDDAGIPCVKVFGTAMNSKGWKGNHSWDLVCVGGQWLHLDATFDDPVSDDGTSVLTHDYFLVTTDEINNNHFFSLTLDWDEQLAFAEWYYKT